MRLAIPFMVPALLFPGTGMSSQEAKPAAPIQSVLEQVRGKSGIPGLAAAVVRDGKIIAVAVSGVRERGKPEPVQPGDRFLVGSCTKPMTRLLLVRLAQAGKLRFDATLPELFPGVPMQEAYRKATVSDLVRHTAGIPAYTRITRKDTPIVFSLQGSPMEQRGRFAEHVLMEAPAGPVGKGFLYSNAGYSLLGNLAERLGGRPWEELMAAEVFGPLGMTTAVIGRPAAEALGPMPKGHRREAEGYEPARFGPPVAGLFAPAGGVVLSIGDFARFAIAQADLEAGRPSAYLDAKGIRLLPPLRPADAEPGEGEVFLGGEGTFTAAFAVWPSKRFGVVVCSNGGDSDDVCVEAVKSLRAAYAPEIPAAPERAPGKGRGLGIQLKAEGDGQLRVTGVAPGSPGQKAGLQAGDEILAINGKPVKDLEQGSLRDALRVPEARLKILRAGKTVECVVPKE